jgi:hypothetical protein
MCGNSLAPDRADLLLDPRSHLGKRLVITTGAKRGKHPSPATVMRMLREHDEQAATAAST